MGSFDKIFKVAKEYIFMAAGMLFYSFGWVACILPNNGTGGGASGLALVLCKALAQAGIADLQIGTMVLIINAILLAELLQLTVGATNTGEASLVVVGKQQLKIHLSRVIDLGGIGKDRHTVGARIYTSGYHTVGSAALGNLNKAKTASTDCIDLLQKAQSRNINIIHSGCFQNSGTCRYADGNAIDF